MAAKIGRPKGSQTKRGLLARTRLAAQFPNYDPVVHLAKMANNGKLDDGLRLQAAKEVAKYVHPQLKAVELTGADGKALQHKIQVTFKSGD